MERVQIIGGGFRGIVLAYLARQAGHEVTLIEAGKRLGGVLNCVSWNGFDLDLGCHLFDNVDDRATSLVFEIAGGTNAFHPVEVHYASKAGGEVVDGIAIPSFQGLPVEDQARMLFDLIATCSEEQPDPASLGASLTGRFGSGIASRLRPMAAKMFAEDPDLLAASALEMGLFRRVRFLDDDVARLLKTLPALDDRLAVSSVTAPMEFYSDVRERPYRNFYPSRGGMGGFTNAAAQTLDRMGVDIRLETGIEQVETNGDTHETRLSSGDTLISDCLFSTLTPDANERLFLKRQRLSDLTWAVPMALIYFSVRADDLTGLHYMHNFNEAELMFRGSAPGLYGRQIKSDGTTYVCAEMPTRMDGIAWTETEAMVPRIWEELQTSALVRPGAAFEAFHILRAPKSFSVGRIGHARELARVQDELASRHPAVHFSADMAFAKSAILSEVMKSAKDDLGWLAPD